MDSLFAVSWQVLAAAVVLDLLLGDPVHLPHPIVWMGKGISLFEPRFRKLIPSPLMAGAFFALFLIGVVFGLSWLVLDLAFRIHPALGRVCQAILLFYCFSARTLSRAAMEVAEPLMAGDLARARIKVGYIVGRETQSLDRSGVTRAAVETVAENFVDGFLSPLCFALALGVPGALAYKMINTLDSMVGYRNEKYLLFGRVSARIDDAANFIPARLSVPIIAFSAALLSWPRGRQALATALSQGHRHKSPNSGYPEAAFAGALGVRMGGPNVYHGKRVEKPYIAGHFPDPVPVRISQACDLMLLSALISAVLAGLFLYWH